MCSTVENVSSYTKWYLEKIFPVMGFNTRATDTLCNRECPMYNLILAVGYHLGSLVVPSCRGGGLWQRQGNPMHDSLLDKFGTQRLQNYAPASIRPCSSPGCCTYGTLPWTSNFTPCYSQPLYTFWGRGGEWCSYLGSIPWYWAQKCHFGGECCQQVWTDSLNRGSANLPLFAL